MEENKRLITEEDVVLRRNAEDIIAGLPENLESLSPLKISEMLQELRVHQIELSMQNEALREAYQEIDVSRARYFDLYDLAPVGYFTISEHGMILEANLTAATLLGVPKNSMVQQRLSKFIFSEDQEIYYSHTMQMFKTGEPQKRDLRMVKQDGTIFWVHIEAVKAQDEEGVPLCRFVISDITALKQTEDKLRKLSRAVEQSPVTIMITDIQRKIEFVNPAFTKLTGYTAKEVIGQNPRIFQSGQLPPETYVELWSTITDGKTWEGEFYNKSKDGHLFWEHAVISPLLDENGSATHYLAVKEDITEKKNIMEQLIIAKKQADDANRAKSEFLANMSHEIRTPMNGVIGMTELLMDTELDDKQRHFAGTIQSSAQSLLCLINDILDFSKIEAKKIDLEIIDFDLANLLDDFASTMAVKSYEKGLEIICASDPAVPVLLKGDPGRLRQILTNLAGNAIKFTAQGEVVVRVAKIQEGDNDVLLRFSVFDTGIGISEDKIGILFEKFSQADASTTRQYGGTGLGLAISKQLSELMGGEIGVTSEEGKGSEFWFTACFVKQPEDAQCGELELADLDNVRGLIVDDNATNREILVKRMTSWGMRPSEAESAPAAFHAFYKALNENDPFKIAVIDMQMPFMNGETLGRVVKSDPRIANTKLVLLSSFGRRCDAKHFKQIGFDGYLTKPVRHGELMVVMAMALTDTAKRNCGESQTRPNSIATSHIAMYHTVTASVNMFADRNCRVLLAEDNIVNQQVALGILKKLGINANVVANGEEAIRAVETIPYDLILMDVQMPVMDGFEATGVIRNHSLKNVNSDIPIIAMTAHAMQGDRERCIEAGMTDYITKPLNPQSLAEALEKWLPKDKTGLTEPLQLPKELGKYDATLANISHEQSIPVFDKAGMLVRLMNDENMVNMLLTVFLQDIPNQIATLKECIDEDNIKSAERQAHTIKGACSNVGGEAMRSVADKMEKLAKAGELGAVKKLMAELESEFNRLTQEIKKELEL